MKKIILFYGIVAFVLTFNLHFVKANFVCGVVNGSGNVSSDWMNVIAYYQEKPSETTQCNINPEKKFCCDLDEIKSTKFMPGKIVFAEVFDNLTGYISNLVSLTTTNNGYDVFPGMQITKAITINPYPKKILINTSSITLNISTKNTYNNLRYEITSENSTKKGLICENCNNSIIILNLSKGKNQIKITAYNNYRSISENLEIYSLDYLKISEKFECKKCRKNMIPANSLVNLTIEINSSHFIEGQLEEYFPENWKYFGDFQKINNDYNLISKKVNGSAIKQIFEFKSPGDFFPRKYIFKTNFEGIETEIQAKVYRFFPLFFFKKNLKFSYQFYRYFAGPKEPLIIEPNYENSEIPLQFIAIYPKTKKLINAGFFEEYIWYKQEWFFRVFTNLPMNQIDKITARIKIKKGEKWSVKNQKGTELNLTLVKEDVNYTYYDFSPKGLEFYMRKKLF